MAKQKSTGITWCDFTFNPIRGCTKVSEGCKNCYADELSKRNPATLGIWGPNGTRVLASDAMWREPLKWDREAEKSGIRPRVFCASLADVFEDWHGPIVNSKGQQLWIDHVSNEIAAIGEFKKLDPANAKPRYLTMDDVRRRLFELIDQTPNLDYLLLTKRPENIRKMWSPKRHYADQYPDDSYPNADAVTTKAGPAFHRNNVWIGTTCENQEQANKRIPELLKCRDLSPVLFLSCEPLLGPVDFRKVPGMNRTDRSGVVDWVIVGSESGPKRRPMQIEWAESLRQQCNNAGVAFFAKQMEVDGKVTTDVSRFPTELQLQVFPRIS